MCLDSKEGGSWRSGWAWVWTTSCSAQGWPIVGAFGWQGTE